MSAASSTLAQWLAQADQTCFVAMDFSPKFAAVYNEIIQPAVLDAGLRPLRGDQVLSAGGQVVDELVELIQRCRAVIVDLTGLNPNACIELGMAHAFKKHIVLLTQDTTALPFDVQARRVQHYELSEPGKRAATQALRATLSTLAAPGMDMLRQMFPLPASAEVLVLHGRARDDHVRAVDPPVDALYLRRLRSRSSETSGIWHLSQALARLAWSRGDEDLNLIAADANNAEDALLDARHLVCLGGPGANPAFAHLATRWQGRFSNWLGMPFQAMPGGKRRYRLALAGQAFPAQQDDMLAEHADVGMVARWRNAHGGWIWLAAGIRAYGTESAVLALTRPTLIADIASHLPDLDHGSEFWAVVVAQFDPVSQAVTQTKIHTASPLRRLA